MTHPLRIFFCVVSVFFPPSPCEECCANSLSLIQSRKNMGVVDRGGGREAKGASLRRSKKNPGAAAARAKTEVKAAPSGPATSLPAPAPTRTSGAYIDASVAILSRQFDAERDRIFQRAADEGRCRALIGWSADVDKQAPLSQLCSEVNHFGFVYFVAGVHPDNVERTNRKLQETWLDMLEPLAKTPSCVAVLAGLDLRRDVGTHYAQESLFKALVALAVKLQLPLMLHLAPHGDTLTAAMAWLPQQSAGRGAAEDEGQEDEGQEDEGQEDAKKGDTGGGGGASSGEEDGGSGNKPPPRIAEDDDEHHHHGVDTAPPAASRSVGPSFPTVVIFRDAASLILLANSTTNASSSSTAAPEAVAGMAFLKAVSTATNAYLAFSTHHLFAGGSPAADPSSSGTTTTSMITAELQQDHSEAVARLLHDAQFPLSRVVMSSESPWHTPLNIEDHYVRAFRNEPSNTPFVARRLTEMFRGADLPIGDGGGDGKERGEAADDRGTTTSRPVVAPITTASLSDDDIQQVILRATVVAFGLSGANHVPFSAAGAPLSTKSIGGSGGSAVKGAAMAAASAVIPTATDASRGHQQHVDPTDESARAAAIATTHEEEEDGKGEGKEKKGVVVMGAAAAIPLPNARPSASFRCQKCRSTLFGEGQLVTHAGGNHNASIGSSGGKATTPASAPRGGPVDKGQRGTAAAAAAGPTLCAAALFLPIPQTSNDGGDASHEEGHNHDDDATGGGASAHGHRRGDGAGGLQQQRLFGVLIKAEQDGSGHVECASCGAKIGRSGWNSRCPCALVVPGYCARITASKCDRWDDAETETVLRLAAEGNVALPTGAGDDVASEPSDDGGERKGKRRQKVNVKKSNTSNMGDFRNKTFVAGAGGASAKGEGGSSSVASEGPSVDPPLDSASTTTIAAGRKGKRVTAEPDGAPPTAAGAGGGEGGHHAKRKQRKGQRRKAGDTSSDD